MQEIPAMQTSIPGLVVSRPLSGDKGEKHEYNLTHVGSGLALLNTVPYHVIRQFVDEIKPLGINWELSKEQLLPLVPRELKDKTQSIKRDWKQHYSEPAPLPVKRAKKAPDRDNVLLIDELQSDWGQKARDRGIKGTDLGSDTWRKEHEDLSEKLKQERFKDFKIENEYLLALDRNENVTDVSNKRANARRTREILLSAIDRHQDKRGTSPVPQGPYIDSTEKWSDLALKYALKQAVDEGKNHLVWTPAKVQTDRYGSAVQQMVDSFHVTHHPDTGTFRVIALKNGDPQVHVSGLGAFLFPREIKEVLGKELTDLVTKNSPDNKVGSNLPYMQSYKYNLEGDVGIGKSGQEFMYDKLIPKRLLALARQHDPDAKLTTYQGKHEPIKGFPALEITPALAKSVKENGFKAFKRGGAVEGVDHALRVARKARGMT
jgi:hypothetical protein